MPVDIADLYKGYQAATSGSFRRSQIQGALNPYKIQLASIRGTGQTDMQLRRLAAQSVLKRHYLKQSGKPEPADFGNMSLAALKQWIASQGG